MKGKILVTGGAGYIGAHAVKLLKEHGYDCVVFDNLVYGHQQAIQGVDFVKGDLLDENALDQVFNTRQISAVMHFAAYAYVGESVVNPEIYYTNNVVGTLNLLKSMKKHGVNKIIFSSTCATYGHPCYTPIDEEHVQNPINPYGRSKLMVENILNDFSIAYGLRYIALRYFNVAGAAHDGTLGESHTPEMHLIPLVLQSIKNGTGIQIFGTDYETPDGTCVRDYIHVEDLAEAHLLALEKVDSYTGGINLGIGIGVSNKEIIRMAEAAVGNKCLVKYVNRRAGDPAVLFADNRQAKKILNWEPKHLDVSKIIETAWKWELNRLF